jgi:hypothetical protein
MKKIVKRNYMWEEEEEEDEGTNSAVVNNRWVPAAVNYRRICQR